MFCVQGLNFCSASMACTSWSTILASQPGTDCLETKHYCWPFSGPKFCLVMAEIQEAPCEQEPSFEQCHRSLASAAETTPAAAQAEADTGATVVATATATAHAADVGPPPPPPPRPPPPQPDASPRRSEPYLTGGLVGLSEYVV